MKYFRICFLLFIAIFISTSFAPVTAWAGEEDIHLPTWPEITKHKALYDDPSPLLKTFGPKQVLPPKVYEKLTFDIDKMKEAWADLIGFKSPDVVGKIAPEIKPGKYTYKDKEKYPGLKKLMYPMLYDRIKPGGPPHAGCIPEFEIVPTRQYYYPLPVTEVSKRNMGKTKLTEDGYELWKTWEGGFMFPRPSGKFRAQQYIYNFRRGYHCTGQNFFMTFRFNGFTKNFRKDLDGASRTKGVRTGGRIMFEPHGWLDKRAEKNGEYINNLSVFIAPRDMVGFAGAYTYYLDFDKQSLELRYMPWFRRIKRLAATDTQDALGGQDYAFDDRNGLSQKLSPTRFPYKYEVIADREFLIPAPTWDGSEYVSSEGLELRGLKFERRPMVVIQMTQLDPNYLYSKRIFYIDKETFLYTHCENYDQKGRLYRTQDINWAFNPEMGDINWTCNWLYADHIDVHSTVQWMYHLPVNFSRKDINLRSVIAISK